MIRRLNNSDRLFVGHALRFNQRFVQRKQRIAEAGTALPEAFLLRCGLSWAFLLHDPTGSNGFSKSSSTARGTFNSSTMMAMIMASTPPLNASSRFFPMPQFNQSQRRLANVLLQ